MPERVPEQPARWPVFVLIGLVLIDITLLVFQGPQTEAITVVRYYTPAVGYCAESIAQGTKKVPFFAS